NSKRRSCWLATRPRARAPANPSPRWPGPAPSPDRDEHSQPTDGEHRRRKERRMTSKADFTEQEWETVLEGPPSAGLIVITAQRGGTFRETFAIGKAYAEAREQHGASELLDEIVSAKPKMDHTRYSSMEELKQHGLQHVRDAIAVLEGKSTADEVEGYRRF